MTADILDFPTDPKRSAAACRDDEVGTYIAFLVEDGALTEEEARLIEAAIAPLRIRIELDSKALTTFLRDPEITGLHAGQICEMEFFRWVDSEKPPIPGFDLKRADSYFDKPERPVRLDGVRMPADPKDSGVYRLARVYFFSFLRMYRLQYEKDQGLRPPMGDGAS